MSFLATTFTALAGVPIDSSGRPNGLERMPQALRAVGLVQQLQLRDLGDWLVAIDSPERDPITGIIGFASVCKTSEIIRTNLTNLLARGERPLLLGGCCTLLIGVFAALREQYGRIGLAFVDGHLDFYDGRSSPTGEAADMELAILTGFGPSGLVDLAGKPPLISAHDVIVLGYRDAEEAAKEGALDPQKVAPDMTLVDAHAIRQKGPGTWGAQAVQRFESDPKRFWLHVDLDVLDQEVLPAVDYRMPNGLTWEEMTELVRPLARSPALVGADLTIYNPTLDPEGQYAKQIVSWLGRIFKPEGAG